MPAPLKDSIDASVVDDLARRFTAADARFDAHGFAQRTIPRLAPLELKARIDLIARELRSSLGERDASDAIARLVEVARAIGESLAVLADPGCCGAIARHLGDPVGAARRVRENLAPDGTFMVVEPLAGDTLAENMNPVGRVYYAFSTAICVPASLNQEVGAALGAQAGEKRLREVLSEGGFSRVRRAVSTPFNMVIEAKA